MLFWSVIFTPSFSQYIPTTSRQSLVKEEGYLPVFNYSAKSYRAAPQNWAILQDKRGVLYIGNNEGILEYDGVSWKIIRVTNETNVRSLCMDDNGRIYAGAGGEIGYLAPDSTGSMTYRSLKPKIDNKYIDFADVWTTISVKNMVYFQAETKIFRWDGTEMRVWEAQRSFHRIFAVNGRIFVRQREIGLMELVNDELVNIKGAEVFADESIYSILPYKGNDGAAPSFVLCTKNKGLYLMKFIPGPATSPEAVFESFKTAIDPFLASNTSYNLTRAGSLYSVGTISNGAAVVNSDGGFFTMLNKQAGLQDELIYSQFEDASGNLWLGTSNGMSKVRVGSPITSYSDKNGLFGSVQTVLRHNGVLYAVTNQGVYFLRPGKFDGQTLSMASFEQVTSVVGECWDLLSFRYGKYSTLLGATSEYIFTLDEQKKAKEIMKCRPWCIYQSRFDSARVYIGLESGLASLYWDGSQWQKEASIPFLKEDMHSIAEDKEGNIWIGHTQGAIKITMMSKEIGPRKDIWTNASSVTRYTKEQGLPESTVEIENVNGDIYFGTTNGLFTFDGNRFQKQEMSGAEFSEPTRHIHRIAHHPGTGNIWMETYLPQKYRFEFGYMKKGTDGKWSWNIATFQPYCGEVIHSIYHDKDGITWFGGSEGLNRYNAKLDEAKTNPYSTIIRKVTVGADSAIFNGTYFDADGIPTLSQNASLVATLPFSNNSVIFEFSSLDFSNEGSMRYQYFLEGFDKGWSNWKHETKVVYTNLPEGQHIFHVKARNIYGQVSEEATYSFTILPPWYRTWWAYVLYVLASAAFVWGVVTYTSRGLKAIIRERTAEIVKQKEVIEYKNRNITDSINYAKRIQEAILPSRELMRSRFPESFILYRPKDIVAGDFYWFAEKEGKFIVAACDCTGHGVPGAFMSLISYSLLNEVLLEKSFATPASALDTMKKGIIKSLGQTGQEGEQKDGMDMSLVSLEVKLDGNRPVQKMSFAGANNPLYILRKGELLEFPADKMPIGIYLGMDKPFTNHELALEPGDTLYLFSDGYADQFGGKQGKKFTKKRYKELLVSLQNEPMNKQRDILERTMDEWLGEQQQIDDVLVMGIRIS